MTTTVIFAALVGAITWNLVTWWYGLPSSSSHALIGGVIGAVVAHAGLSAVNDEGLVEKVLIPGLVAPVLGVRRGRSVDPDRLRGRGPQTPGPVARGYRLGQFVSSSLFALAHGTNDAQKTMGIITLALIANGNLSADSFEVPTWVVLSSAAAIALGTYSGGWRIIRTMGTRIIKMDPAQGFSAQSAGASVLFSATALGYPLSTTQVISGAVMGAGAAKSVSAVRWGIAGNIAVAWVLTIPAAALVGAVAYGFCSIFGSEVAGPLLIVVCAIGFGLSVLGRRSADRPVPAVAEA